MNNFPIAATSVALTHAASQASTVTGSAVNLMSNNFIGDVEIIQDVGSVTGSITGKIQDSADGSTGWADVSGAAFTVVSSSNNTQTISLDAQSTKGYIRYVGTIVTGPVVVSAVVRGLPKYV